MQFKHLKPGQQAILSEVTTEDPGLARRLEAMGFKPGQKVKLLRKAPMNGPLHVRVGMTTEVAMRPNEAEGLHIMAEDEWARAAQVQDQSVSPNQTYSLPS